MKNNPIVLVIVVVIFVAVIAYIIYSNIKRRNASWTGTVIDKNMTETAQSPINNGNMNNNSMISFSTNNAINRQYTLRIKDGTGKEFSWPVGQGFYDSVNVGDKLTKSPGTETPTKVQ